MQPFEQVRKELSATHKRIADYYIRMSKVSDRHSFDSIQGGIDSELKKAAGLMVKLEEERGKLLEDWKTGQPPIIF